MARILVLNPTSSVSVTAAVDRGLAPLRFPGGPEIICDTLAEGPAGIETQAHIESVVQPIARRIADDPADAFVLACFSDPGLFLARETVAKPVLGIGESAFFMAAGMARTFGIISILDRSIPRHLRYVQMLGLTDKLAGDRAANTGVAGLADGCNALDRLIAVGRALKDQDGAGALVLGCAGMTPYRTEIEAAVGIPVIDPTQAAVARAIGLIALGYGRI